MPPRTRSNRAAITELRTLLKTGKNVNSTGFASLPNEIYSEIVSHIPRVSVSCHTLDENQELAEENPPSEKLERHVTLHFLSQTCRALRSVFLRYLWQTIEVMDGFKLIDGRRLLSWRKRIILGGTSLKLKLYAEELLRQLETVTVRNPSLAQHVNCINVLLLPYSIVPVCKELFRCIPLLPNLTTVRLFSDHYMPLRAMTEVYQETTYAFPQVRHAYLNKATLSFASTCPNLVSLFTASDASRSGYRNTPWRWEIIGNQTCASIEVLGIVPFHEDLTTDLRRLTNLRDITLEIRLAEILVKDIHDFSESFKRLQTIRIRADQLHQGNGSRAQIIKVPHPSEVEEWVKWAERLLRRVQQHDNQIKKVHLTVHGGTETLYLLEPGSPTHSLTQ